MKHDNHGSCILFNFLEASHKYALLFSTVLNFIIRKLSIFLEISHKYAWARATCMCVHVAWIIYLYKFKRTRTITSLINSDLHVSITKCLPA